MASQLIQAKVAAILEQPLMKIALDALNLDKRTSRELARAMLKNPRSAWQEQAFSIIRSYRIEGYEDLIRRRLRDRRVTLRIAACCAARDLNRKELTQTIVALAANDPSDRVRLWAIQTLKTWGQSDWKALTIDFQAPRRLNPYERADWLLLRKYALGQERDPHPRSTANACVCHP